MTHKYRVTGMSCDGCVSTVQEVLSKINGIVNIKVTLKPPAGEIEMQQQINVNDMNTELQKFGKYKIEELA